MSGYVKIYGSILGSSIWAESIHTRIVWITMLAMADEHGRVEASVSGLARIANVTITQCRKALEVLLAPDLDDRSGVAEGRRIEKHQGGWTVINYLKYREMRSPKQIADAERQKQWRTSQRCERDNRDMSQMSQEVAATVAVTVDVKEKAFTASDAETAWDGVLALVPDWHARKWTAERHAALPIPTQRALSKVGGFQVIAATPDEKRVWLKREFVAEHARH